MNSDVLVGLLHYNGILEKAEFKVYWSAMRSPPAQMESSTEAPSIPRLQFQPSPRRGRNTPAWQDSSSLNEREMLHSGPSSNFDRGINSHQIHALGAMVFPSPKDWSVLSTNEFTSGQFGASHRHRFQGRKLLHC